MCIDSSPELHAMMHWTETLLLLLLFFLDPGTSFPGCETLRKVCGVWNGYNGDSEIVKVLDRQTALKCYYYYY